jgi:hypothetical protein
MRVSRRALSVAPLIVSAAPCLLMCAFGLCMIGRGHKANSGSPGNGSRRADQPDPTRVHRDDSFSADRPRLCHRTLVIGMGGLAALM